MLTLKRSPERTQPGRTISGTLRVGARTKDLCLRIRQGEIALIHHADLDEAAARGLVERRVAAVVNAAPSITGRYPNRGPSVLADAGIPLLDVSSDTFFQETIAHDGQHAIIEGATLRLSCGLEATGEWLDAATVQERIERARQNVSRELDSFVRNTLSYLENEKPLLLDPIAPPLIRTGIRGRHALVIVRGEGYKEDLRAVGSYLRDVRPVLIAVDGGADALLEVGLEPDIIIGDMDSVSDEALQCGAELVVHGYPSEDRIVPGMARLERLGLQAVVFRAAGTSEDIALLLADAYGASLIVAVGTHFSMVDFLEKGRKGMASTFLVRLRIGTRLVDAKGIGKLWAEKSRPAARDLILLFLAALFPLAVFAWQSPFLRTLLSALRLSFDSR